MYFKDLKGYRGSTNSEEFMLELEKHGYERLFGRELFTHIVLQAVRKWGIPAVAALVAYELTHEFVVGLIVFVFVQNLLD